MKVTAATTYIMSTHIPCLVGYISFTSTAKTRPFLLYEDKTFYSFPFYFQLKYGPLKFNSGLEKFSYINLSELN